MNLLLSRLRFIAACIFLLSFTSSVRAESNDMFAKATDLGTTSSASLSFRTQNATRQVGEPTHSFTNTRTVWWRWTAPSTGDLRLKADAGSSWSGIAVYTGTALDSLTLVKSTTYSELVTEVTAGTTYHLVIGANSNGTFRLEHFPSPPNDNFTNRTHLGSASSLQIAGWTYRATREAGEPAFASYSSPGPSVWWSWQAPQEGIVRLQRADLASSTDRLCIAIYTGDTLTGLTKRKEVSHLDPLNAVTAFRVKAGETLSIVAAADGADSTGRLLLDWNLTPQPYQDTAADALDLGGVMTAGGRSNNIGASYDPPPSQPGVWWKWTAPVDSIASWKVTDVTANGAEARAYSSDMTLLDTGTSHYGTDAMFACRAGQTYYLLASTTSREGDFDYQFSAQPSPANDYMANAAPLILGENPFTTYLSSIEAAEPSDDWDSSLWWDWTAPSGGRLILDLEPQGYQKLVVYQVAPDGTFSAVGESSNDLVLNVTPSQRYRIGVVVWWGVSWTNPVPPGRFSARFAPTQSGNDAFANAIDLGSAASGRATGDPTLATIEPGEPVHFSAAADRSLWWKWTAPAAGQLIVNDRLVGYGETTSPWGLKWYRGSTLATLTSPVSLVAAGDVIHIAVLQQPNGTPKPETFEYKFIPFGSNDALANATDLGSPTDFDVLATLNGATIEANEPPHFSSGATRSRWWKWTAPANLNAAIRIWDEFNPIPNGPVDVYKPNGTGGLSLMPRQGTSQVYALTSGTTYYISLASSGVYWGTLRMRSVPAAAGDFYDQPVELGSVTQAALIPPSPYGSLEPVDPVMPSYHTGSYWWRWTAPAAGLLFLEESSFDQWLILREDSPDIWTPVTSPVTVQAGQVCRLVSFGGDFMGHEEAVLKFDATPPNDLRANATDLGSVTNVTANGLLRAAYAEAGDPVALTGTAWWTWTAPFSGALRVNALSEANDTVLAVLAGPSAASASLVKTVNASGTNAAETTIPVTAGSRYWIMVGSNYARSDDLTTVTLEAWPTAQNDHWQAAVDLGDSEQAEGEGRYSEATREAFESTNQAGSVWWKWTAPRTGNAVVSADVSGTTVEVITVYQDLGGAAPVAVISRNPGNPSSGKMSVFRAQAGVTYYLGVATATQTEGKSIRISVDFADQEPNDDFASATSLSGTLPLTSTGNARVSTLEAGEPEPSTSGGSLWWNWTAPSSGHVLATLNGGTALSVYTGATPSALTLVGSESTTPSLAWQVTGGVTYRLRAIGEGALSLRLEAITPPANDLFANRQSIGTTDITSLTAHNFFATAETSEPAHAATAAARSIWYRWTPASTGRFEIDTRASGRPMNVAVYHGTTLTALTAVASSPGRVGFTATAGVEHVFAIDGAKSAPVSIEIRPSTTPPNDNFANRTVVTGKSFALAGDNFGATVEASEPLPGTSTQYPRTLWWEWTAPMTGMVQFTLTHSSSSGTPQFRVLTSSNSSPAFSNLSLVSISPAFNATIGVRYFFQVIFPQAMPASGVSIRYEGTYPSPSTALGVTPPNDRFASWTDIGQALGVEIAGDVTGSTLEPGQSGGSGAGSIGWKWTAPTSGWFAIRRQINASAQIRVLSGTTWASLTTVASGNIEYLWFQANAGESLWIEWQSNSVTGSSADSHGRFASFIIIPEGAAPVNDSFTLPQTLPAALTGFTSGSTSAATAEAGEPMHGGTAATRSVWYEWTATTSGPVNLSASSATLRAGVYTGSSLASLVTVASGVEPLLFNATAGTTYRIALDGATPAFFSLTLREPAATTAPANDHFANSILLTGAQGSISASTSNATLETAEPLGSSSHSASTWWHWTAPASGPVTWQSTDSTPAVSAYTGEMLGELHMVFGGSSKLRFHAVAGTTYRICTSDSNTGDFVLSWQQETTGPANDNFAQAIVLPGTPSSASGTLVGSSREDREPRHANGINSDIERSVWYAWTAPASGVFRLSVECAVIPTLWVYRNGSTLDTLDAVATGRRILDLSATSGVTYYIAIVGANAANELPFQLTIEAKNYGDNDMFANRTHLGSVSAVTWEGTTEQATQEPGEPQSPSLLATNGTRWWSWTAPATGAAILRRVEPSEGVRPKLGVYTGAALASLVEIDESSSSTVAFPVTAGTTYQFQVGDAPIDFMLQLSLAALEHDDFDDPLVLPSSLPVSSQIPASGASTQMGETATRRSVWWRWTAPADGWVDADYGASDFSATLWVGEGSTLARLIPVPVTSMGIASNVRRFFAKAGTTYSIAAGSDSEQYLGMARLTLSPASGTGPANDHFAAALPLSGESVTLPATSRGATLETEERIYLSSTHRGSLWWTWVAPRSGVVNLRAVTGWSFLYQGDTLTSLTPVGALGGAAGIYPVTAGQSYRIAAGNPSGLDFTLELALSPPGDLFSQPVVLSSVPSLIIASSISACSYEEGEPYHASLPASRSRWFRWTAPATGPYRIVADGGTSALRVAVYSGSAVTSLTSRGKGTRAALFTATAGQTYAIAVDAASNGSGGDFTLSIAPEPSAYTAWRSAHFNVANPNAGPDSDPDGDGRANLIELALGSDPISHDSGATFLFTTTPGPVHLQVRHPSDLDGWHLSFDVSPTLAGWLSCDAIPHTRWTEDHGDGTSTLHVTLTDYDAANFSSLFFRLRVEDEAP